jgi:hypothetical protein
VITPVKNPTNRMGHIDLFDDAICNKCEKTCKIITYEELYYGIISEKNCGNSKVCIYENDKEIRCKFALCCECLNELFLTFKIPVEKEEW